MDYRLVYDVTTTWPPLWFPAFGLIFVALGALLWRSRHAPWVGWNTRWPYRTSPQARALFAGAMLGFSLLWTTTAAIQTLWSHASAVQAVRIGRTSIVVGKVEDFHPMPSGGHGSERFRVGDVHFAYSDDAVTSAFHHTTARGGPMKPDLYVRIHYTGLLRDATILRLEIWDGASKTAAP